MNPIVYRITLDLSENGVQYVVSGIKVGDTNRKIEIRLANNGTPYEIEPGTVAQIRAKVGDVNHVDLCEVVGNVISYTVNPNMICREGETIADVELGRYDESGAFQSFATAEIMFLVYDPVVETGTVPQEYQGSILEAVDAATSAATNAEAWAGNAETAAYKASNAATTAETAAKNANDAAEDAKEQTIASAELTEDFEIRFTKENGSKILVPGSVRGPEGEPDYSLVAPALKGKKSGNPVALSDVSPLEHEIKVKLVGQLTNKNLFHFINGYKSEGVYDENSDDGSIVGNPWSYEAKKDTSRIIINNPSGDVGAGFPETIEWDLTELIESLNQDESYTISAVLDGWFNIYSLDFDEACLLNDEGIENGPYTFKPSELSNKKLILYSHYGEGEILIQLEKGNAATKYEDYGAVKDVNGAVVQKYGLNLFDQETFFRNSGFELQADGSWIGKRVFKPAFTPPVQIKGSMYIRLKGKNISAYNPFYLTVNYVEGGQSTACTLPKSMTKMEDFSFATRADKTVKNIYWNYSGTGGSDGVSGEYYIKDVIFSYADAPYEPYTGEQETLTATDGNLSILGNGESMTLIAEDGVTMEADYNRDINKAFAELMEKVEKLGGNA